MNKLDIFESDYYDFNKNSDVDENKHYFLSEELLVPRANNSDTQRLNMFSNHINQFVHLKTPEYPKVFTNFENQVGEYSIAYKKAEDDFEVIHKIVKNPYNYDLIIRYKSTGVYDILHYRHAVNITEEYGYALNDSLTEINVGDTVKKGDYIYKSDNYDDDGNFKYGVNLKAVYLAWKGFTYEDGIVISQSAADKLTSYKVEKTSFAINSNDVLLNLYGNDEKYKSIPRVGDHIDTKTLTAIRRRNKFSVLYDFQNHRMQEIDPVTDDVIYTSGGTVVDINIFNNITLADMKKRTDEFNGEVAEVLEDQYRYWREMAEALEEIIPCRQLTEKEEADERAEYGHVVKHAVLRENNPNKYTDEIGYYWKISHENIDDKIQWRYDGKSFENFKIEFTILKENPLTPGCKLTGRLISSSL